jgi:dynein light chain 1
MSKNQGNPTASSMTLGGAVKQWTEANSDKKIENEVHIKFTCTTPPIDRIDNTVNLFTNCIKLSLSTNMIDKIPLLPGSCMPNLRVLSLGRNQIKKITGLEEVGATLKELWISYNQISTLDGLSCCTQLETLFISNNRIKDTSELKKLTANLNLVTCNFVGNPIYDGLSRTEGRMHIIQTLPQLKTLDGELITETEITRPLSGGSGNTTADQVDTI